MHYLVQVPELEQREDGAEPERPTSAAEVQEFAKAGARRSRRKLASSTSHGRRRGGGYGARLLALVMLNVLDEKWKDHLYDLDQLRAAIHYRSWGQKDPLVEYKQEAYTMFVDLMNDVANTFTERFLKAQLVSSRAGLGDFGGPRRRSATHGARRAPRCAARTTRSASSRTSGRARRRDADGDGRRRTRQRAADAITGTRVSTAMTSETTRRPAAGW
jgi:preprotein translocase subunit SecA